jgi:hypothetical protein
VVPFVQTQQNQITLQQDNASPHVAHVVRHCFVQNNADVLLWTAVSLDLSALGYVWDVMGQRLLRLPDQPVTLANLGQVLTNIWNNIPQAFFNTLVTSMRHRCQVCLDANGRNTRY